MAEQAQKKKKKQGVQIESAVVIFSNQNLKPVAFNSSQGRACTSAPTEGGERVAEQVVGGRKLIFETNGLKALYFQGVETGRFQHGVNLMST